MLNTKTQLNTIEEAIEEIRNGKIIIVVDDEDRENEGDFVAAAEAVTPEMINFMVTHGRGLVCVPITDTRAKELDLKMMVEHNTVLHQTAFTVSVDLKGYGCTTGISVHDRAKTIKAITNENTKPEELGRPGHIFPLVAKKGGVLRRTGHTEAAIDIARLAGFKPMGILVEILNEDGSMARLPQLLKVAKKFDLKIVSIENLVAYRMRHDSLIEKKEDFQVKTSFGEFRLRAYLQKTNKQVHIALTKGTWTNNQSILTRINSFSVHNDIIEMLLENTDQKIVKMFDRIGQEEKGAIIFINQELQSINLLSRLATFREMQEQEKIKTPKIPMDDRDFGIGAQILHDINISKIRLLSNSKQTKRVGMIGYGLEIIEQVMY